MSICICILHIYISSSGSEQLRIKSCEPKHWRTFQHTQLNASEQEASVSVMKLSRHKQNRKWNHHLQLGRTRIPGTQISKRFPYDPVQKTRHNRVILNYPILDAQAISHNSIIYIYYQMYTKLFKKPALSVFFSCGTDKNLKHSII